MSTISVGPAFVSYICYSISEGILSESMAFADLVE